MVQTSFFCMKKMFLKTSLGNRTMEKKRKKKTGLREYSANVENWRCIRIITVLRPYTFRPEIARVMAFFIAFYFAHTNFNFNSILSAIFRSKMIFQYSNKKRHRKSLKMVDLPLTAFYFKSNLLFVLNKFQLNADDAN